MRGFVYYEKMKSIIRQKNNYYCITHKFKTVWINPYINSIDCISSFITRPKPDSLCYNTQMC